MHTFPSAPDASCLHADAARLHDVLEQLEPISQRQGLSAPAGMSDLIWQHKELQQQIAETQQRAAKLRLVADVEKRQAQFEACLSAGRTTPPLAPLLTAPTATTELASSTYCKTYRKESNELLNRLPHPTIFWVLLACLLPAVLLLYSLHAPSQAQNLLTVRLLVLAQHFTHRGQ